MIDSVMNELDDEISSDSGEEDTVPMPSRAEAQQALKVISDVYRASNASLDELKTFSEVEGFVLSTTATKLKQTVLDKFFATE